MQTHVPLPGSGQGLSPENLRDIGMAKDGAADAIARVATLETRLSAAEAIVASQTVAVTNLTAARDAHQAAIAANASAIQAVNAAVAALTAAAGDNAAAIAAGQAAATALQAKVDFQTGTLAAVQTSVAALSAAQTADEALAAAQAIDIATLRGARATNEAAIAAATSAITAIQANRTTDAAAIAANAAAITALQGLRATDAAAIGANSQAIAAIAAAQVADEASMAAAIADIGTLKTRATTTEANVASNALDIVALKTRATTSETTLQALPSDQVQVPAGVPVATDDGAGNSAPSILTTALRRIGTLVNAVKAVTDRIVLFGTRYIDAQPGEQGIRDALATAFGLWAFPGATIAVRIPAQADIQPATTFAIDTVSAGRVYIQGPAPTLQPPPIAITAVAANGADPGGTPFYNVTFTLNGVHALAVGQSVWLTARSTLGTPSNGWQPLPGFHQVVAVPTTSSVTLRIPSWISLAGAVGIPLNGAANSVTFSLERSNLNLLQPTTNPGTSPIIDIVSSKLLGLGNLGFIGNGGAVNANQYRGLNIRGASTLMETSGRLGFRNCGVGLSIDDGAIARFGSAPGGLGPDAVLAASGCSNHGCFVGPAAFATFRGVSSATFSGNGGTTGGGYGLVVIGGMCDVISANATPLPGVMSGNYDGGAGVTRLSRATVRFPALYLPIWGNVRSTTAAQVYADGGSFVDMLTMDPNIPVSPAANGTTYANTGANIIR